MGKSGGDQPRRARGLARPPTWLRRVPAAITQIETQTIEEWTRADIQVLLGISKRWAVQLMHAWGATHVRGRGDLVITRTALLRRFKTLQKGRLYQEEVTRVARVQAIVREARLAAVRVAVEPRTVSVTIAGLPEGVTLDMQQQPRRLIVEFTTARESVAKLFAIAQALKNDWDRFEAMVESGESHRGRK